MAFFEARTRYLLTWTLLTRFVHLPTRLYNGNKRDETSDDDGHANSGDVNWAQLYAVEAKVEVNQAGT